MVGTTAVVPSAVNRLTSQAAKVQFRAIRAMCSIGDLLLAQLLLGMTGEGAVVPTCQVSRGSGTTGRSCPIDGVTQSPVLAATPGPVSELHGRAQMTHTAVISLP